MTDNVSVNIHQTTNRGGVVYVTPSMTISQLRPIYLAYRGEVAGKRGGTLRNDACSVKILQSVAGDIQPRNITTRHADQLVRVLAEGKATSTFNARLAGVKAFFRWCQRERLLPRDRFPVDDVTSRKISRADRHRLPVERFEELLDAAGRRHPRDRVLCAIGLYLFLRASEVRALRLKDLDLDAGEIHVYVLKTDDYDIMPISAELDVELRRWLTWYEQTHGTLNPDWLLVPRRASCPWKEEDGRWLRDQASTPVVPAGSVGHLERPVKVVLTDIGWQTTDNPTLQREGMHTLRRSGARAYFDSLVDAGYDGALKRVSAMLHHSSVTMTERYLGIREDRHTRNIAIRGQVMFPKARSGDQDATIKMLHTG